MAIYHPADIAKLLQVKEPTIRKYSLLLEEVGYTFKRNASGQRWYTDTDVVALRKLVALKGNGAMNLKDAAEAVLLWSKGEVVTGALSATHNATDRSNGDITDDTTSDIEVFTQLLKDQERRYIQALQDMQQQQRERDSLLLETITELQQQVAKQQEQLNAPTTEPPKVNASQSQPQQPKKSLWARLFKN